MSKRKNRLPTLFARPAERRLDVPSLRAKAQADPAGFAYAVQDLVDNGDLSLEKLSRGIGLKGLYSALKDIPVHVKVKDPVDGGVRGVDTGALPIALGGVTLGMMQQTLAGVDSISDQLVMDRESNKPTLTIPGVLLTGSDGEPGYSHDEGTPYNLIGPSDEKFEVGERPQGLRMQITEKAVRQDDINAIQTVIEKFTMIPEEDKEEHTLRMVTDHNGSASSGTPPYVLHYNKSDTALYNTTAINATRVPNGTRVQNNALTDYTSLETARAILAGNRNERDKPVSNPVNEMILLVPDARLSVASRILRSESVPGNVNEQNDWGPSGQFRPRLVSTAWLDAKFSASAWYLGNFQKQFIRKISQQLNFLSISGPGFVDFVRSGVLMEMSYSWDWQIGATSFEYVLQNLSGTTAPADE
jgi:hypothetical protein